MLIHIKVYNHLMACLWIRKSKFFIKEFAFFYIEQVLKKHLNNKIIRFLEEKVV